MSPPLLVLDGAPPSELKSVIVNSRRVRARRQTLPSETKLTTQSGFPPCSRSWRFVFLIRNQNEIGELNL